MLLWTMLGACGWWESYQACTAAEDAETTAWTALNTALDGATTAALAQAGASLEAARAVDAAQAATAETREGSPTANRGELAQDAFTSASRAYGTDRGLAQATWTDWSVRTQDQISAADALIEQSRVAMERLGAWTRAVGDSTLATQLASTRYEAAARVGPAREVLTIGLVVPPSPRGEDPALATLGDAAAAALAGHAERTAGLEAALAAADRLTFEVDRAGQTAAGSAAAYPFLGFPPEAQVASAAALSAEAVAARAADAARLLGAAASAARKESAPAVPAEATVALDEALARSRARAAACE